MNPTELAGRLDDEFKVTSNGEDLVKWAVTENNAAFLNPRFLRHKTGLMAVAEDDIVEVRTAVFVTDAVVGKLRTCSPCLLVAHHNFDYYDDERGLQPIGSEQIQALLDHGHSIYVAHAGLDTHAIYGSSLALASLMGLTVIERFYDYFGEPTALVADAGEQDFQSFAELVRMKLHRPSVSVQMHHPRVRKIAVVAGGGDTPDFLEEAYDRGCDTVLMGTLENRWAIPEIQDGHKLFLRLNDTLRLNLIGGSHFGTERPVMIGVLTLFEGMGVPCDYCEDEPLLSAGSGGDRKVIVS